MAKSLKKKKKTYSSKHLSMSMKDTLDPQSHRLWAPRHPECIITKIIIQPQDCQSNFLSSFEATTVSYSPLSGVQQTFNTSLLSEKNKTRAFFFLLFRAALEAHGSSQARVKLELQLLAHATAPATTTATQDLSRIFDLYHSSQQRGIPNPPSEARDQTRILTDTWNCFLCVTMGTPKCVFKTLHGYPLAPNYHHIEIRPINILVSLPLDSHLSTAMFSSTKADDSSWCTDIVRI